MVVRRMLLPLWLGLLLLASCQQQIKVKKGRPYQISGQVAHCEGCEVKLQLYDYNRFKTYQTAIQVDTVVKGRFAISGSTTRPGFYEIHIKPPTGGPPVGAIIYLPDKAVNVAADM